MLDWHVAGRFDVCVCIYICTYLKHIYWSKPHAWFSSSLCSVYVERIEGAGTWNSSAFLRSTSEQVQVVMQNAAVPAVCGTQDGRQATWVSRTALAVKLRLDKGEEPFWWLPVLFSLVNSQKNLAGSMYAADAGCSVLVTSCTRIVSALPEVSEREEMKQKINFSSLLLLEVDEICLRFRVRWAWTLQPRSACCVAQQTQLTLR